MNVCVIRFRDGYANIKADEMTREDNLIFVHLEGELVGVFDLNVVDSMYLSAKREREEVQA